MQETPNTWFAGKSHPGDESSGANDALMRAAMMAVLCLVSISGAVVAAIWYALFASARFSTRVVSAFTGLYFLLLVVFGGFSHGFLRRYFAPWGELLHPASGSVGQALHEHLWGWLGVQLPLSVFLGSLFATVLCSWRWLRRPKWERNDRRPTPWQALNRLRSTVQIKTDRGAPSDGITLGVEEYGQRVVHLDSEGAAHTLVAGGSGSGKALDVDTLIPTPSGFRCMGDLAVGDTVFDEHGQPTEVVGAFDVEVDRPCFEVTFTDGSVIVADGEHLWATSYLHDAPAVVSTAWIQATLEGPLGFPAHRITSITAPVAYPEVVLDAASPRAVGFWLAEEDTLQVAPVTTDVEFLARCKQAGIPVPLTNTGTLQAALNDLHVFTSRRIPAAYLRSGVEQRAELLIGLMDGAGQPLRSGGVAFTVRTLGLALDVQELLASLGVTASLRTVTSVMRSVDDARDAIERWVVTFTPTAGQVVFSLPGKRDQYEARSQSRAFLPTAVSTVGRSRGMVSVKAVASRPVRCIKVASPSSLFLAGRTYIATHNTTTMLVGMRDVIRMGRGLVVVDLKGGPDVPAQLAEWSERYGRKFLHWSITDRHAQYTGPGGSPAFYDPIGRGDPSRRKDLILGSQKWDVEYYKTVIGNYLQAAFSVASHVPPRAGVDTFTDLAALLTPATLMDRANAIPVGLDDTLVASVTGICTGMEESERSGVRNMYARLNTLIGSTAGAWLRGDPSGERDIDLRRAADEGWVVVFSLDSSNYEETSAQIAGLVIQDLKTLTSELRRAPAPKPFHVYIDEFSAIGSDNVMGLLAKARDAKMPVTLSTQALADLSRVDISFVGQVLGIVNCFIIHRANTEEDSEVFAGLTGKEMIFRKQYGIEMKSGLPGNQVGEGSATGGGFIREDREYKVLPSDFQDLKPGEMVYIAKAPKIRVLHPVKVVREDATLLSKVKDHPSKKIRTEAEGNQRSSRLTAGVVPDGSGQPLPAVRSPKILLNNPAAPVTVFTDPSDRAAGHGTPLRAPMPQGDSGFHPTLPVEASPESLTATLAIPAAPQRQPELAPEPPGAPFGAGMLDELGRPYGGTPTAHREASTFAFGEVAQEHLTFNAGEVDTGSAFEEQIIPAPRVGPPLIAPSALSSFSAASPVRAVASESELKSSPAAPLAVPSVPAVVREVAVPVLDVPGERTKVLFATPAALPIPPVDVDVAPEQPTTTLKGW